VRPEEFINYFDYRYPNPPRGETFAIHVDAGPSPVLADPTHRMMRVGVQGYATPADERPNANLTFVIDVSGSMDMENRLGLAKRALYLLVDELRPSDNAAIVVYGDTAHTVLPMTPAKNKATILRAINRLAPEGATNAAAGLELGYDIAAENLDREAINRVILVSDGVANVGATESGQILRLISRQAEQGVNLTTIGMGMGNYNDVLMEQLADDGDGFYAYVDTLEQARRVFVDQLTSTLLTIAKDAKIQVEFNPEVVEQYRLVGYENRKVKDDDFREDDVDAGEVGAGHSVTALYELALVEDADPEAVAATVRLRWQEPASGEVVEIDQEFTLGEMAESFAEADPRFQLATVVAGYAEVLRHSEYGEETWLGDLHDEVERIAAVIEAAEGQADADVEELAQLIQLAESMTPTHPASLED
jgi:Ca-activated chloride channel family protein